METRIIQESRQGAPEAAPEFTKERVTFFPVAKDKVSLVNYGETWEGRFGDHCHDTGKKDKRGVPIFIRYFIPERKIG